MIQYLKWSAKVMLKRLVSLLILILISVFVLVPLVSAQDDAPRTEYPVTVEYCGQSLTFAAPPERIVASWVEQVYILLSLGLDENILGYYYLLESDRANISEDLRERFEAVRLLSGGGVSNAPAREVVVQLQPDFFYSSGAFDFSEGNASREDFASMGAVVFDGSNTCIPGPEQSIDMLFDEIETLGVIFDRQVEAQALVQSIQDDLDAVAERIAGLEPVPTFIFDSWGDEPIYVLGGGYWNDVIARAGGVNLVPDGNYDGNYDTPPSRELLAIVNPEVVFSIAYPGSDLDAFEATLTDVIANSPAAQNDRIVRLPTYPGDPRIAEWVEAIARALHPEAFAAQTDTAARTQYPVTVESCGEEIVIPARPERVIASWTGYTGNLLALDLDESLLGYYYAFSSDTDVNPPDIQQRLEEVTLLGTDGSAPSREVVIPLQPDFFYSGGEFDFAEGQASRDDFAEMGTTIYTTSYACLDSADQTIDAFLDEIITLGIIFDRQAEAGALVAEMRAGLDAVAERVGDAEPVGVVWLDAFSSDPIYPLGNGYYTDVIQRAGGINLFDGATYDTPPSREALAVSAPEVILMITYPDTEALITDFEAVFQNSPAVAADRLIAGPYYGPLRTVELVEFAARAFHPAAFE
jgi:iron complex transport system substrate-binding protein